MEEGFIGILVEEMQAKYWTAVHGSARNVLELRLQLRLYVEAVLDYPTQSTHVAKRFFSSTRDQILLRPHRSDKKHFLNKKIKTSNWRQRSECPIYLEIRKQCYLRQTRN